MSLLRDNFRLLVIIANPGDEEQLRTLFELDILHQALAGAGHQINIDYVFRAKRHAIFDKIESVSPHAVHIIGHGSEDELIIESDEGEPSPIDAAWLADVFAPSPDMSFLFLNSCRSAEGIAQQLVDNPATPIRSAIGWKHSVFDSEAKNFSRHFYAAIARGDTVKSAFRRAQISTHIDSAAEPVLFLRNDDVSLIPTRRGPLLIAGLLTTVFLGSLGILLILLSRIGDESGFIVPILRGTPVSLDGEQSTEAHTPDGSVELMNAEGSIPLDRSAGPQEPLAPESSDTENASAPPGTEAGVPSGTSKADATPERRRTLSTPNDKRETCLSPPQIRRAFEEAIAFEACGKEATRYSVALLTVATDPRRDRFAPSPKSCEGLCGCVVQAIAGLRGKACERQTLSLKYSAHRGTLEIQE